MTDITKRPPEDEKRNGSVLHDLIVQHATGDYDLAVFISSVSERS